MTAQNIYDFMMISGLVFLLTAGWGVLLLAIIGLCRLSNKVSHMVLESYGGWTTFNEYRKWYYERKETNHGQK